MKSLFVPLFLVLPFTLPAAESPLLVPVAPVSEDLEAISPSALFVATDGADTNSGRTVDAPLASVQRAADLAEPGDTVYLRQGTYRESIRPARSGLPEKPISFTSYPGERATISGADVVGGDWTVGDGGVASLQVDYPAISPHNFARQIFLNGKMLTLARWPNTSDDVSRPKKSRITEFVSQTRDEKAQLTTGIMVDSALAEAGVNALEAEIFFQPNTGAWSWAFSGNVTAQDAGKLTFTTPNGSGKDGGTGYPVGSRYYLFNSLALLDAPGEWFYDEAAKRLLVIPPAGISMKDALVETRRRDWAFDLDDRQHIVIRDMDLFACSITTDRAAGGDGKGYHADGSVRYPWRGKVMGVAPASDILISGIRAKYLSHFTDTSGHFILQWGQGTGIVLSGRRLTVRDSVLQFCAGNGVTVLGRGNAVTNNLILDTSYAGVDPAGISTGGAAVSEDHVFSYNTIARCGRSGITPREMKNSNPANPVARIHHNDIFHCMLQDWDGGGVYAVATDARFLRIDHNLVHDMDGFTVSGLYTDYAKNYILDHNIIWNVEWGFTFQGFYHASGKGSGKTPQANNTLAYNNTILVRNTSNTPYGPFGFAGSRGENVGTVIKNNIIAVEGNPPGWKPFASEFAAAEIEDNLVFRLGESPVFVDAAAADFALAEGSPAIGKAARLKTLTRDGMAVKPFAKGIDASKDLGALAFGKPVWQAGCNLPERTTLAPWKPVETHGDFR